MWGSLKKSQILKLRSEPVKFVKEPLKLGSFTCPICESQESVDYLRVRFEHGWLQMVKCACGSLYFPGRTAPDYSVVEGFDSFYMRIDQAEGIDSIILPLFLNDNLRKMPVADIGCGMGFGADFLRFIGREVVALDPSSAAKMSSEILGIEILNDIARPGSLSLPQPSLMYASEVIEHVDDPLGFLQTLRSFSGANGYALLTTPNAGFVSQSAPVEKVLAMLAPSQHLFLFSPPALEALARKAGFCWAASYVVDERLFLVCGPRALPLELEFDRALYRNYLGTRLSSPGVDELTRIRCFGFRLFKELIHAGEYEEGKILFDSIRESYKKLGLDLGNPRSVARAMRRASKAGRRALQTDSFPFNLGPIFALMVTYEIAYRHDVISATPYANAVLEIGKLYQNIFKNDHVFFAYDLGLQFLVPNMKNEMALHGIPITDSRS